MLKNTPLANAVLESLDRDHRIPHPNEIAVSAEDGVITLRGMVESFSQVRRAAEDARTIALQQTHGAYEVDNQLNINLPGADRREDDKIRGVALQTLIWDTDVSSYMIDVKVQHGWVTLKGDVTYQFQSDAAYDDVASLYGVYGVTNEIKVNER